MDLPVSSCLRTNTLRHSFIGVFGCKISVKGYKNGRQMRNSDILSFVRTEFYRDASTVDSRYLELAYLE